MVATRPIFQAAPMEAEPMEAEAAPKVCEAVGCASHGIHRAPRSRNALRDYRWFCLQHVREYNAAWDYYKDMSAAEIEANLRADTLWQRPTWPLGRPGGPAAPYRSAEQILRSELNFAFGTQAKAAPPKLPNEVADALGVLGLTWPVSLPAVKATYKTLAKRYHPDTNNGDKKSEEIFKSIHLAYITLSSKFPDLLLRAAPGRTM